MPYTVQNETEIQTAKVIQAYHLLNNFNLIVLAFNEKLDKTTGGTISAPLTITGLLTLSNAINFTVPPATTYGGITSLIAPVNKAYYVAGPPPTYTSATQITIPQNTQALDDAGNRVMTLGSSVVMNLAATGVTGMDTGVIAANTNYYIYLISKPDNTVSTIASASATSPTLPTGYTLKKRLPFQFKSLANNTIPPFQILNWPVYPQVVFTNAAIDLIAGTVDTIDTALVIGGQASTYTAVSAANFISTAGGGLPPNAVQAGLLILTRSNSIWLRPTGFSTDGIRYSSEGGPMNVTHEVLQPLNASQQFDYKINNQSTTSTFIAVKSYFIKPS